MSVRIPAIEVHYANGKVRRHPSAKAAWEFNAYGLELSMFQKRIKDFRASNALMESDVIVFSEDQLATLMATDLRLQNEQKVTDAVRAHMKAFNARLLSCDGHPVHKPEQVFAFYTNNDMKIEFQCQYVDHPPYQKSLKRLKTQCCPICARKRAADARKAVLSHEQVVDAINQHLESFHATLLSVNGEAITEARQVCDHYDADYMKLKDIRIGLKCQRKYHPPYIKSLKTLATRCPECVREKR